uniref:Golgi membrane protein 1 n=2 Tax=Oryctolagus cuniculus TaxID=9986 RepID=G1SGL2_RABIT
MASRVRATPQCLLAAGRAPSPRVGKVDVAGRGSAGWGTGHAGTEAHFLVLLWQILGSSSEMMGLGSGRRSMKSPPLLLAALVACVIVLGFNYWIASSRSVDLQTRIVELEGRVRRAAAERGAVELKKNEFQGELERQRGQLDKIQSSHSFQLESVNKMCQDEKAVLVNNITTGEKLIRVLQDQFKTLQRNYGRLQQDILQFQKNQSNLERKFSYDLNQCISQMKEVKEQCEERIEEVTRKGSEGAAARDPRDKKEPSPQLQALSQPQPRPQEAGPPAAEVQRGKGAAPQPSAPSLQGASDLKSPGGKEDSNAAQAASKEEPPRGSRGRRPEPGPTPRAPEDPVERDQLVVVDGGQDEGQDKEPDAADAGRGQPKAGGDDYGAEENEAESETDKQAALAGGDQGPGGVHAEDQKRDGMNSREQQEKQNRTL